MFKGKGKYTEEELQALKKSNPELYDTVVKSVEMRIDSAEGVTPRGLAGSPELDAKLIRQRGREAAVDMGTINRIGRR